MDLQQLTRGTVAWDRLERVMLTVAERYDRESVRVEFLEADNWLSIPAVVDGEYFVKMVSRQNALVQALMTAGRNVGAVSTGTAGFFERFSTPREMVEHEHDAMVRMHEIGVNVPRPIEAFEVNGLGVLVMEYLPSFRPFADLEATDQRALAPELFETLETLHAHELAHGDVRGENILEHDGAVYLIDVTLVDGDRFAEAAAYDLACVLAMLEPRIGARDAVTLALETVPAEKLLHAREFLQFVGMRPDHQFDVTRLQSEIENVIAMGNGPSATDG